MVIYINLLEMGGVHYTVDDSDTVQSVLLGLFQVSFLEIVVTQEDVDLILDWMVVFRFSVELVEEFVDGNEGTFLIVLHEEPFDLGYFD